MNDRIVYRILYADFRGECRNSSLFLQFFDKIVCKFKIKHYLCHVRFKQRTYLRRLTQVKLLIFTKMTYFISYNGRYIASRKSLKTAVDFIEARGLHDDAYNELYIVDKRGNCFSPDGDMMEWI